MVFNQFDEVDNIHNEQQQSKNGSLRHTAKKTSDERSESAATYILCPTDEIRPKPSMSSAVDAEGLLQTLQQDVVINGVEGCREIE